MPKKGVDRCHVRVDLYWGPFLESPGNLSGPERSINNVENDTMELSVNEAELAGLWARNFATIQQVLNCLRVQKVTGPFKKLALGVFFKESYPVLSLATTRRRKKDWVKIPFQNSPMEEFDTIDVVSRATIRG